MNISCELVQNVYPHKNPINAHLHQADKHSKATEMSWITQSIMDEATYEVLPLHLAGTKQHYSTEKYTGVCLVTAQPLLIQREWFAQYQCNLAAIESRLECTCMKNDDEKNKTMMTSLY